MNLIKQPGDIFFLPKSNEKEEKDFVLCQVASVQIEINTTRYKCSVLRADGYITEKFDIHEGDLEIGLAVVSKLLTIKTKDVLSLNIDELNNISSHSVPVRTINCLRAEGIYTVKELVLTNETEILQSPNLGGKSVSDIKNTLESLSLRLGMEESEISNMDTKLVSL